MRDKLIELIGDAPYGLRTLGQASDELISVESIADYLISHGVTFADVPESNVGNMKPSPGFIRSITATECDGYVQLLIDFYWDGCSYPIVSKVSHAEIVGMGYEKKRRWIPASERLPEEVGEYNVFIEGSEKATSLWYSLYGNGWYEFEDEDYAYPYNNVTHWMPLPEPPKEDA